MTMAEQQPQQPQQSQDTDKKKSGTLQKAQKSNEVTERERVKDKGYVERITEKTQKH
jgi:hypothetical protein